MSHAFEAPAESDAPLPLPRWPDTAPLRCVGQPAERASARAKVTGEAIYTTDVRWPGMLHAVIVRAPVARGRVTRFDAEAARRLPGVRAVYGPLDDDSGGDAWPGIAFTAAMATAGRRTPPAIGADIGFHGQEIGVIVADDEAAARAALRHLHIACDTLAACLDTAAAQADGAPALGALPGNRALPDEAIAHGDLAAAQALADVTLGADYSTEAQHHVALEPHACVAWWRTDAAETLTLWDSSQGPHMIREQLAHTFDLPFEAVRVLSRFVGGGFGSKIHLKPYHVIAAAASRRLGRPVRLAMARREAFVASQQRAPTQRRITLGASRADGRLRFIAQQVVGQAGPTPWFARNAAGALNGLRLHSADAVQATLQRVLTNTQAPTPFRGPTAAEDLFCLEQAIDELAHALGCDPLAFRRAQHADIDLPTGLPYAGKQLERCYALGTETFGWHWQPPPPPGRRDAPRFARGIGLGAVAYDSTPFEPSEAAMALTAEGRFELRLGLAEIGCGSDTVFAQIAAEVLQLPAERIATCFGDSRLPRSIDATNHSRTLTVVGPAVRQAAQALRDGLLARAAQRLGVSADRVAWTEAGVTTTDGRHALGWTDLAAGTEHSATGRREALPPGLFAAMFGAHFVEVQVDRATGRVRVLRAVCAHDAGRIVNPRLAAGQVRGGFLQGMGMALQEQRLLDATSGAQLNATLWAYRTPSIVDAPPEITFVDAGLPDGGNSLGVKGLGEPPLIAAGAAIANAVFNAIGVRLRHYPITPERVLAALQAAESS